MGFQVWGSTVVLPEKLNIALFPQDNQYQTKQGGMKGNTKDKKDCDELTGPYSFPIQLH